MVKALYHCASNGQGTLPLEVHCTCNGQGTLPLEVLCTCNDQGPKDLDHWTLNWFHADYQLKWGTILRRNGNGFLFMGFVCYKYVPYLLLNAWMIRCSFFSDARGGCNCQYMFEPADLTVVSIAARHAPPARPRARPGRASSTREQSRQNKNGGTNHTRTYRHRAPATSGQTHPAAGHQAHTTTTGSSPPQGPHTICASGCAPPNRPRDGPQHQRPAHPARDPHPRVQRNRQFRDTNR